MRRRRKIGERFRGNLKPLSLHLNHMVMAGGRRGRRKCGVNEVGVVYSSLLKQAKNLSNNKAEANFFSLDTRKIGVNAA